MAFTFQKNEDIQFIKNEKLLKKAIEFTPSLKEKIISDYQIVKTKKDVSKYAGWTIEEVHSPMETPMGKGDKIILDFKKHCVGYFKINLHSIGSPMDAPLYMKLTFSEIPAELEATSDDYSGWLSKSWIQEEYIHLDELPFSLELPRRYSFRYVKIEVIDTSPKWKVILTNPEIKTVSCVNKEVIDTKIENPELQKIYAVGLKTLADCMQTVFEDGPKRDRRLWLGDLRLQALANYESFNQVDLVKRCLYLFAAFPTMDGKICANVFEKPHIQPDDTFLFDYSLFFISTLYDFLCVHEDDQVLNDLFDVAKTQMDSALKYVDQEGQLHLELNYPVFVDWSNDFDKSTAGQAIMIYVLKQMIGLCKMKKENFEKYQNALNKMCQYSIEHLYDKKRQLFISNGQYNIASQVWMVIAGVFEEEKNKIILSTMIDELFPIRQIATPYMYHHIVEAMFIAGLEEEATELMIAYWGKMIDLGGDTFFEAFDPNDETFSPYGSYLLNSYCHAWSCTPVYLIKKYVLKGGHNE